MIRYSLCCENGDAFEAWFRNSEDFDAQAEKGLIDCPHCGDKRIQKALMAPAVRASRDVEKRRRNRQQAMAMADKLRDHVRGNFDYVGERFPEEARKIHAGESDDRPIWGEASADEAKAMIEEGLAVAPLPPEITPTPPRKVN
ncbi:MAG: DUF1178 family protein [Hyphomonadaceae bacterium]